jgi:Zn-dependent peptidase ImmA (M78 family)
MSHCILEHPPSPILSPEGCRYWNTRVEEEADWLAAALLIPREGALTLTKRSLPIDRIAAKYGVSKQLCRWRINETGVAIQVRRWSAAR